MNSSVEPPSQIYNVENEYRNFILNEQHPCIMAKTLFEMYKYLLKVYKDMKDSMALNKLIKDLGDYNMILMGTAMNLLSQFSPTIYLKMKSVSKKFCGGHYNLFMKSMIVNGIQA